MKEKTLQNEKKQNLLGATEKEGAAFEAQKKARRWRKVSIHLLAAANDCIHGRKKSGAKIDGIDVQAFWLGPTLFMTLRGFDPPPEVDKTP